MKTTEEARKALEDIIFAWDHVAPGRTANAFWKDAVLPAIDAFAAAVRAEACAPGERSVTVVQRDAAAEDILREAIAAGEDMWTAFGSSTLAVAAARVGDMYEKRDLWPVLRAFSIAYHQFCSAKAEHQLARERQLSEEVARLRELCGRAAGWFDEIDWNDLGKLWRSGWDSLGDDLEAAAKGGG